MSRPRVASLAITRVRAGRFDGANDDLAVEAPLEIRVAGRALAVTLRTPGHDRELALGFLAGESVIASRADVEHVSEAAAACDDEPDVVDVRVSAVVRVDWTRLERHFAATSSCGLCGRVHLDSLRSRLSPMPIAGTVPVAGLLALPDRLRAHQTAFGSTGGIHAAALVDPAFEVEVVREDVGRHNAVDKVTGWLLDHGRYPANGGLIWVSGRAGAEIVLKAAHARIPVMAAVGAPSTLAVALAESAGMTLVGFLREGRMNVYCGLERIDRT